MGDVGSARYEPALLPPCLIINGLKLQSLSEIHSLEAHFQKFSTLRVNILVHQDILQNIKMENKMFNSINSW